MRADGRRLNGWRPNRHAVLENKDEFGYEICWDCRFYHVLLCYSRLLTDYHAPWYGDHDKTSLTETVYTQSIDAQSGQFVSLAAPE